MSISDVVGVVWALRYDEATRADLLIGPHLKEDAPTHTPYYDALLDEMTGGVEMAEPTVSSPQDVMAWAAMAQPALAMRG